MRFSQAVFTRETFDLFVEDLKLRLERKQDGFVVTLHFHDAQAFKGLICPDDGLQLSQWLIGRRFPTLALRETSLLRLILNIGIALLVFYILFVLKVPSH